MSLPNEFAERVEDYIARRSELLVPHTTEEYFTVILQRAARASAAGNYGISAAMVLRSHEVELVSLASSTMVTEHDPLGHAEINAIRRLKAFLSAPQAQQIEQAELWTDLRSVLGTDKGIFLRSAADGPAAEIYTSLEPCPMCTVAIMTARVDRVNIALPDEPAGALGPGRLDKLPPLWPALAEAQGLRVKFVQNEPGPNAECLPQELTQLLYEAFRTTKGSVERGLIHGALFEPDKWSRLPTLLKHLRYP